MRSPFLTCLATQPNLGYLNDLVDAAVANRIQISVRPKNVGSLVAAALIDFPTARQDGLAGPCGFVYK